MRELQNFYQLLIYLDHGKQNAQTVEQLSYYFSFKTFSEFKSKLCLFVRDARLHGHWIIDDNSGYYLAVTKHEWEAFCIRRFPSVKIEFTNFAVC